MFLLLLLCTAAAIDVINNELILAPWDPAHTPYKTDSQTVEQPVHPEDAMYYPDQNTKMVHELSYELKQLELEPNRNVNPVKPVKDDIHLGFDEEAAALIKKLTRSLQTLNKSILKHDRVIRKQIENKIYMVKAPENTNYRHSRNKRETDNVEDVENSNNTVSTTEAVIAEVKNETAYNKTSPDNSTDSGPPVLNCNETLNTRRNFNEDLEVSNAVKARLLSYIKEYFHDIEIKINSLRNVKKAFASDNEYNIGYMIANIDMLEVNLRNLKTEMEKNRHELGEKHILDMFDKVKVSNNLVTSLISALKSILESKAVKTAVLPQDRVFPVKYIGQS